MMSTDIAMEEIDAESVDDELLIDIIRSNPILYDKSNADYKNMHMKNNTWTGIGVALDRSVEDIQHRWSTLRTLFNRELRAQKIPPSGSEARRPQKEWPYFSAMSFMKAHVGHRKMTSSCRMPPATSSSYLPLATSSVSKPPPATSSVSKPTPATSSVSIPPPSTETLISTPATEPNQSTEILSVGSPIWNQDIVLSAEDSESSRDSPVNFRAKLPEMRPQSGGFKRTLKSPPSNTFAKKKMKEVSAIEKTIGETSKAIASTLAEMKERRQSKDTGQEVCMAQTLCAGLKRVPVNKKTACFIDMMSVLAKYQGAESST